MKRVRETTFENIDIGTAEGQLLQTAIGIIAFLKFPKEKPDLILEVIKDVKLDPLRNESLEKTMERVKSASAGNGA